jgi:hypothetical protein
MDPNSHTKTCIDHIFTDKHLAYDFKFATDDILNVDHKGLLLTVIDPDALLPPPRKNKLITYKRINDKYILENNLLSDNLFENFEDFIAHTRSILDDNSVSVSFREKFKKPFMSIEIFRYMIIRENYNRLKQRYPHCTMARARFKYYRNLVVKLIRESKYAQNEIELKKNLNDTRKIWRSINSIIKNNNSTQTENTIRLVIRGNEITSSPEIADFFNNYFITSPLNLRTSVLSTANQQTTALRNIESYSILYPFCNTDSTESEVLKIICEMKNSGARDVFGFSNNLIKKFSKQFASSLSSLINKCLNQGLFPNELKIAIVKPVHKSGAKTELNNYRPIAILPIFSKVYEYAISNRFNAHLKNNHIISDFQFGFVSKSNTETAVLHIMSTIYNNIENKKLTACMFLDLRKAFDCLDHCVFVEKLKILELPKNFSDILVQYFTNRSQCVEVNGSRSGYSNVSIGTPQGSVLGPLTFILYINGIFKLQLNGKIQAYADDLAIVYGENNPESLKAAITDDLNLISDYLTAHHLSLNPVKTKYILFRGRTFMEYFTDRGLSIRFNNELIERVDKFKYLGFIIDECLNSQAHIEHIISKITPMIYAIRRIRHFVNQKTLHSLYFAHIYTHLTFMNPIWSIANQEYLNRLFVLQKKCLKFMMNKPTLTPSVSLFSEKILPLPAVSELHLLVTAFKIKNNMIKNNVAITYVSEVHQYDTRRRGDFYVYGYESRYGAADFYRRGLIKFNELPSNFKTVHSLRVFKNRIREKLYEDFIQSNTH